MGNSVSMEDPELRSLVHQINSYFNSKSTLLYQISLIKLKLNSRSSYDSTDESQGISNELNYFPCLISNLKQLSEEKAKEKSQTLIQQTDFNSIFQQKDEEIELLEEKYLEAEKVIADFINIKDEKLATINNLGNSNNKEKFTLPGIKEKCAELIAESENLNAIVQELKEKLEFLNKKKAELMITRGNKRKTYLGMSILNKAAMDLRSKDILKQELIKTIQQTKSEQDAQLLNFQSRNKLITMRNENLEEEEMALSIEISQNKDKILELEWEIQKLNSEKNGLKLKGGLSGNDSINLGHNDRFGSGESEDEGSFGSSLASLLNGFGDYRLEKEAMAEENLKLKEHIRDIISVKRISSPGNNF